MDEKDLQLRSEEVRQVMSHMPHWLIRWGITGMFFGLLILLLLSFVVKYPDIIKGRVILTTESLPVSIMARENGRITHLFVTANHWVKKNEHLAVIENAADYSDMIHTRRWFIPFLQLLVKGDSVTATDFSRNVNLGRAQSAYSQLLKAYQEYTFFTEQQFSKGRIAQLMEQVESYTALRAKLTAQQQILKEAFELTRQKYQTDRSLLANKVISRSEFDLSEKQYLKEKYELENTDVEVMNKGIQIQNLQNEILKLRQGALESGASLLQSLKQAALNFEAQLSDWEATYLLKSPIAGQVSFFKYWTQNQFVKSGTELMLITPRSQEVFGYVYVSSAGFGKINKGQNCRLRLDGFPYEEFGSVRGVVASKSEAAREGNYLVRIDLPDGLKTNYSKELHFTQEMQGEIHIITEDLRLIERLFYRFRHLYTDTL